MISYVENQFLLHHYTYLNENFLDIVTIAFQHEPWKRLQEFCLDHICPNPSIILTSTNFLSYSEAIFSGILQRDDLVMKEIDVWDMLLTWGINQEPRLGEYGEGNMISQIVEKWCDEEFETLRDRLKNCIQFVRFSDISPEDFFVKIRPLKNIFPEDLYEEILWKFISPRNVIFESKSFDVKNGFNLSRIRKHQVDTAIYSYANCGPQWGGNDLRAWGSFNADCCQCVHYRYENAVRNNPDLFSAEEFEVFQLVKRI
ncbi:2468_t:CDS:2 [Funneliformis caledonium]|uniref:2468_t:CDS:1 n=1 Tax=Funneliformis caledonium TaxID=1117310 RepID=A0A9N8Z219_9GLOM|nr:2468_t:CDS:2 [Funneliformis caledonium]